MSECYIGLMSGTSLDGVDAVLVDFSREPLRTLGFVSLAMPDDLRADLMALQTPGPDELHRAHLAGNRLTELYAQAVRTLLREASGAQGDVAVRALGAHGQTLRHRPELGYSVQQFNGALLAELTGLPVACDFRSGDIAAGGQGAPLVPAFHTQVFGVQGAARAIVNIGGFANISVLIPGQTVIGYDTGPGNVLMDLWCQAQRGQHWDEDGRWAATGEVQPDLLAGLLAEPWFRQPPPRSTGRDLFNRPWLQARIDAVARGLRPQDVQATLLELTARTVLAAATDHGATELWICGGGVRNGALMRRLDRLGQEAGVRTGSTAALGADPQAVEALAFAWLARQRIHGAAGNLPAVTGARGLRVLGALYAAP